MATTQLTYSPEANFRQYLHQLKADFDAIGTELPVSTETIVAYLDGLTAYDVAFAAAKDPQTNSKANTLLKNNLRRSMTEQVRSIVRQITAAPSTTPELLTQLGMPVRSQHPTPVPTPTLTPVVTVEATGPTTIRVTAKGSADARSNARPSGVQSIAIVTFAGDEPPADARQWGQATLSNRTTATIDLPNVTGPSTVWVSAWFLSPRNASGPASQPVQVRVLGAGTPLPHADQDASPMKIAA